MQIVYLNLFDKKLNHEKNINRTDIILTEYLRLGYKGIK